MSEDTLVRPGGDLIGRVIRLSRKHPSDRKMSSAFLRCYPCELRGGKDDPDVGMRAVIAKGTSEHPCRTKCDDCGRHMGWFGAGQYVSLNERIIDRVTVDD